MSRRRHDTANALCQVPHVRHSEVEVAAAAFPYSVAGKLYGEPAHVADDLARVPLLHHLDPTQQFTLFSLFAHAVPLQPLSAWPRDARAALVRAHEARDPDDVPVLQPLRSGVGRTARYYAPPVMTSRFASDHAEATDATDGEHEEDEDEEEEEEGKEEEEEQEEENEEDSETHVQNPTNVHVTPCRWRLSVPLVVLLRRGGPSWLTWIRMLPVHSAAATGRALTAVRAAWQHLTQGFTGMHAAGHGVAHMDFKIDNVLLMGSDAQSTRAITRVPPATPARAAHVVVDTATDADAVAAALGNLTVQDGEGSPAASALAAALYAATPRIIDWGMAVPLCTQCDARAGLLRTGEGGTLSAATSTGKPTVVLCGANTPAAAGGDTASVAIHSDGCTWLEHPSPHWPPRTRAAFTSMHLPTRTAVDREIAAANKQYTEFVRESATHHRLMVLLHDLLPVIADDTRRAVNDVQCCLRTARAAAAAGPARVAAWRAILQAHDWFGAGALLLETLTVISWWVPTPATLLAPTSPGGPPPAGCTCCHLLPPARVVARTGRAGAVAAAKSVLHSTAATAAKEGSGDAAAAAPLACEPVAAPHVVLKIKLHPRGAGRAPVPDAALGHLARAFACTIRLMLWHAVPDTPAAASIDGSDYLVHRVGGSVRNVEHALTQFAHACASGAHNTASTT